jgi:SAM-dependent methyltransferase
MDTKDQNLVDAELGEIRSRYDRRSTIPAWKHRYYRRAQAEREETHSRILRASFDDFRDVEVLEIGAGGGGNLQLFHRLGVPWENITANELLDQSVAKLRANFPSSLTVLPGNALDVRRDRPFDIVLASTVFSSILDLEFRRLLANHLLTLVSDRGLLLWYDFVYRNPWNHDVRGLQKGEIRDLFKGSHIEFHRVTLTPPVALLVGPLYRLFSSVPFLRSHLIASVKKS